MEIKKNKSEFSKYLGTTRKVESVVGSFYTFYYRSKSANEDFPLIINLRRNGTRVFTAKNGNRYMSGIKINQLGPTTKALLIQKLGGKRVISYKGLKGLLRFIRGNVRQYDVRKMRNLQAVDETKYLRYLGY